MLPKVIDLFSGCGGLSLGFEKAGFDIAAGIELMPDACQTINYNLNYRYNKNPTHISGDISKISPDILKSSFGREGCIVIGGPPCQAYSIAGKFKLRSLGEDRLNINDERGYLFREFLRFVFELDAKAVIMENVPESMNFGDLNVPEVVCGELENHGYTAYWTILNAADYGVPQTRERMFIFGIKNELNTEIPLPVPTHKAKSDIATQYNRRFDVFLENRHFIKPKPANKAKKFWVTVREAFSDLPVLFPDENTRYQKLQINDELDYQCKPQNEYQKKMRTWYGSELHSVSGNVFRNTPRDFPIFSRMKQGDNYLDAVNIAMELFEKKASLFGYEPGSEEYINLQRKMVPIYDSNKFLNKWKRIEEDKPSHTLVAHLSVDTYSHLHPREPRGISVREAARIQSFPDDFFFSGTMGDAYKQIGNAVPPLLAFSIAKCVKKGLRRIINELD